jgi:hypothetical protein
MAKLLLLGIKKKRVSFVLRSTFRNFARKFEIIYKRENKDDDSKRNPRLVQEILRVERSCSGCVGTYGNQGRPNADVH